MLLLFQALVVCALVIAFAVGMLYGSVGTTDSQQPVRIFVRAGSPTQFDAHGGSESASPIAGTAFSAPFLLLGVITNPTAFGRRAMLRRFARSVMPEAGTQSTAHVNAIQTEYGACSVHRSGQTRSSAMVHACYVALAQRIQAATLLPTQ